LKNLKDNEQEQKNISQQIFLVLLYLILYFIIY